MGVWGIPGVSIRLPLPVSPILRPSTHNEIRSNQGIQLKFSSAAMQLKGQTERTRNPAAKCRLPTSCRQTIAIFLFSLPLLRIQMQLRPLASVFFDW